MKRLLLFLTLSSMPCAVFAMENTETPKVAEVNEESLLTVIKQYFNIKSFCLRLAAIFADERDDAPQDETINDSALKAIINAYIDALKIEKLPIFLSQEGQQTEKTIGDYFDGKKLKDLLKKINTDYFDLENDKEVLTLKEEIAQLDLQLIEARSRETQSLTLSQDEQRIAKKARETLETTLKKKHKKLLKKSSYTIVKMLRDCLKHDQLQKHVGFIEIEKALDAILDAYKGNPCIDDCISLEKLPALFGYKLENFCQVGELRKLINQLLRKERVSARMIFDCFKFQPLLRHLGCKEENIEKMNLGLHGLVMLIIDLISDKERGYARLWDALARIAEDEKHSRELTSSKK